MRGVSPFFIGSSNGGGIADAVWRGSTQAARINIDSFANVLAKARTTFNRRVEPHPIRSIISRIPIFRTTGTNPMVDVKFSGEQGNMLFQHAIGWPFIEAATGLVPRIPFLYKGRPYATYDSLVQDAGIWYLESDLLELPYTIPANSYFHHAFTAEVPVAAVNVLPSTKSTNYINRWTGIIESTSTLIDPNTNGGFNGAAITATSFTPHGNLQNGVDNFYDPVAFKIPVSSSTKCILRDGTSITQDVSSGNASSGAVSDARGDVFGSVGLYGRAIRNLGYMSANVAKASLEAAHMRNLANWEGRRQFIKWMNPTHIISEFGFNDLGASATPLAWVASTPYAKYDVVNAGGARICLVGGVSGTVAPTGTAPTVVDGGVTWAYFGDTRAAVQRAALIVANIMAIHDQYKLILPNVKIIGSCITPAANSTDSYVTTANQTFLPGAGGAATPRGFVNNAIRTQFPPLRLSGFIDPNPFLEHTYPPTETSLWRVDGTAFPLTPDGRHPHGRGYLAADQAVVPSLFT